MPRSYSSILGGWIGGWACANISVFVCVRTCERVLDTSAGHSLFQPILCLHFRNESFSHWISQLYLGPIPQSFRWHKEYPFDEFVDNHDVVFQLPDPVRVRSHYTMALCTGFLSNTSILAKEQSNGICYFDVNSWSHLDPSKIRADSVVHWLGHGEMLNSNTLRQNLWCWH